MANFLDKIEKELFKIKEYDAEIERLCSRLEDEKRKYAGLASPTTPPPDNTKGFSSAKGKSDPVYNAYVHIDKEGVSEYIKYIQEGIDDKKAKRLELIFKLERLRISSNSKKYAQLRYINCKSVQEVADTMKIHKNTTIHYRKEVLNAWANKEKIY